MPILMSVIVLLMIAVELVRYDLRCIQSDPFS